MENKVVWKEGLFIRPQHFQQNDRYYDYELKTRTLENRANNWGFFDLDIDENLLNTGKILIKKASGIFPDGTLFNISSKYEQLVIDIRASDVGKYIYLTLPLYTQNSDDIHFEDQENLVTRYKASIIKDIPNTNAGEISKSDLIVAKHNYKLQFEEDINGGLQKLKIAKISNISTAENITLDENFEPTFLHLESCIFLLSQIKELSAMINYRCEKLADKISDNTMQSTELGHYLMLQLLNKAYARIDYYLSQEKIHPDSLFLELSSLCSELAVFMRKERRDTQLIKYNHYEQNDSFNLLLSKIKDMLSMVLDQNSISLNIEKKKYGIHIIPIKDKKILEDSTFIFAVSADISTSKLKEVLTTGLKIGTIETIKNLVNFHLVGFKLKSLQSAPKEIPYKVNHLYFKIELTKENREELAKSAGFAFHLSSKIENISYALWVIKE
ncbi:type VI secretion system baseplate subunit TssK [Malaciobacter molluscorum LMG 25693]|uniref:Type VI secretion system baseplate subunit TssK n=1 Tax=Malaciobacter molluscorum LMG 25693 TaxID=870501 RepID=A0A2G1DI07_9BACT|nr:type VI secretion system baseplate subunit TssK [Malaciobacter molluscorum]AXX92439.1 type VI secretion system, baseplate protein [Malaciobacter molluscorum LMG 25693]PHO18115.1 type VI secretion system baseplate subunit TssK [Malaciobacter molluscorum LMG 25693]